MAREEQAKFGQLARAKVQEIREWLDANVDELGDEDVVAELEDMMQELETIVGQG